MQKKALQVLAEDIANGLLVEIRSRPGREASASASMVDLLLQRLARNVVALLREAGSVEGISDEDLEARLRKAERRLQKVALDDDDDDDDAGSSLPNLKYAKPKYKSVDSVLKYIEADDERAGVKLVIMNFND